MSIIEDDYKDSDGKWVLTKRTGMKSPKYLWTRIGVQHQSMMGRVRKGRSGECPSYAGVSVSEEFEDAQRFGDWCVKQTGWGLGYHLDKDLLHHGNKVYCAEHCVFIPQIINCTIVNNVGRTSMGLLPGTYYRKEKRRWEAQAFLGGKSRHLGRFSTEQEAHEVYCAYKETHVKALANQYRDTIDPRAYEALMNWTVDRTPIPDLVVDHA